MSTPGDLAVDKSVKDYVSDDDPGALVTGWVLIAVATVPDDFDATAYHYLTHEGQPIHVSMGLLEMARERWRRQAISDDE